MGLGVNQYWRWKLGLGRGPFSGFIASQVKARESGEVGWFEMGFRIFWVWDLSG